MTQEEFENLGRGDIVRHVSSSDAILVEANYGDHVLAVDIWDMSNPEEWVLVAKANHTFKKQ